MRAIHPAVIAGRPEEIATLAHMTAAYTWDTPIAKWLIPDPSARPAVLSSWYSLIIEQAIQYGYADLSGDRRAAAIWMNHTVPIPAPPDYLRRLTADCGPYTLAILQYERILQRHRPRNGHAELVLLAADARTAPQLLAYRHRRLDEAFVPAHTVAADTARHGILTDASYQPASACRLTPNGPTLTVLRRSGTSETPSSLLAASRAAS